MSTMADEELVDLHGELVPRSYAEHIRALVDDAPPLTREQVEKLRVLWRTEPSDPPARDRGRRWCP